MKIIVPGIEYELEPFEKPHPSFGPLTLHFVHREPFGNENKLVTVLNGTTLREVLRACEACLKHLDSQIPDVYNEIAISNIQDAMTSLDAREFDRKARGVHGRQVK